MMVRVILIAPPTLTLPLQGGGDINEFFLISPSPLRGEGWGGGEIFITGTDGVSI